MDDIKYIRDCFTNIKDYNLKNASLKGQLKEAKELGV